MTNSTKTFTIAQDVTIGLMDESRTKLGTTVETTLYRIPGRDAESALEDLLDNLAEDRAQLEGLEPGDAEYAFELMRAIDDIPGRFRVYEGELDAIPDTPALFQEGEYGPPVHWRVQTSDT